MESARTEISKSNLFFDSFSRNIDDFREEKKFCDVTLAAKPGDFSIDAHKIILGAASEYFLKMFATSMAESDKKNVVDIPVDGDVLKSVIEYIYTESIELKPETVQEVFKAAHLFKITSIQELCSEFMAKKLGFTNCLGFHLFAEKYNLENLLKSSEDFVCENFIEVSNHEEFFQLEADQLIKFLSKDNLRLYSEEDVFRILKSWVDHEKVKREEFMGKLLQHVRWQLLTPEFIANEIEKTCNAVDCGDLIMEANKWHSLPVDRRLEYAEHQVPRKIRTDVLMAFSGWNNDKGTLTCRLLYPESTKWIHKTFAGLAEGLSKFGSTSSQNKLIIAGGILTTTQQLTDSVHCLDLETWQWTALAPLRTPRHSFKMAFKNGSIYAVGGIDGDDEWIKTIEKWDPFTKQWTIATTLQTVPFDFKTDSRCLSVCASSCELYMYFRCKEELWKGYVYNPKKPCESGFMNNTRRLSVFIVESNEIPLHVHDTETLIFDCSKSPSFRFSKFDEPINKDYSECVLFGGKIFVFGKNILERYDYDGDSNQWKRKLMEGLEDIEGKLVVVPRS